MSETLAFEGHLRLADDAGLAQYYLDTSMLGVLFQQALPRSRLSDEHVVVAPVDSAGLPLVRRLRGAARDDALWRRGDVPRVRRYGAGDGAA